MTQELEQINPYDKEYLDYWIKIEHLGRYLYVADFIKNHVNTRSVIDAACGFGYGAELLADAGYDILAIENNHDMLHHLNFHYGKSKQIKIFQRDLETEMFDKIDFPRPLKAAICFETLEHLANPEKLVEEFFQILDHDSYLFLSIPNDRYESLDEYGNPVSQFHKRSISKEMMEKMLAESGFVIQTKLGQSLLNQLMKQENKLYKKKRISEKLSDIPALQENKNILHGAYIFAYPDQNNIEKSYSRIYVAQKP
jgi:2-polyprenyl-3-methyl-5-hydroxy-6-metoxy-1,4-benzoquinol methylase